ncbi:MAG: hypothetical protein A3F10_05700 [Coxiella sp. RIFCSPHIGHO2_12_FULL_42_15]|nr:MAG: hypothetical protein A3F10_05700 [Coxiella sp. RIFCSPHIGHO2_12_FULL_42_15]
MLSSSFDVLLDNILLDGDARACDEWCERYSKAGALSVDDVLTILRRLDDILKSNGVEDSAYGYALWLRANMHQKGQGGSVDYPAAIALYDRAINLGNARSMYNRASMHQNGQGGRPVDYPAAIALYDRAINLGNARSMYNRALMHELGQGGPIHYQSAIALYDRAINLGNARSMYNRACMHELGQGGPVDYPAAIALFDRAINLGNAKSMYNRACMHQNGQGGPVDNAAAAKLYYRSLMLGQKEALTALIKLADNGKIDACFYLVLIGLSEDQEARKRAISFIKKFPREIRERLYDEVLKKMNEGNASEVWIRETLDFVDQHVNYVEDFCRSAKRNYIDFKFLILQGKDADALVFYYEKLSPSQVMTPQELFLLGSAQLELSHLAEEGSQKDKLRHQALQFFHQGKSLRNENCQTMLFRLHQKHLFDGMRPQDVLQRFELKFLDDERRQELRQQIKCIENFITIITFQSKNALSITGLFKKPAPDRSVIFAQRLLADLEDGQTLGRLLMNEELRNELALHPVLNDLVQKELGVESELDLSFPVVSVHDDSLSNKKMV